MKIVKYRIRTLINVTMLLLVTLLCACGKEGQEVPKYQLPKEMENLQNQTVAEQEELSLTWDSTRSCVLLEEKTSGKIWSTIPYEFYKTDEVNEDMYSPISIEYVNTTTLIKEKLNAYTGSISTGNVSSKKIDNGIEVTYYFDSIQISVPVQYCLEENGLTVTVDFEHVTEGDFRLLNVSVAPYLCSTANATENAYLVVPSGSGALMYVDERQSGTRTWSGEIYGADPSRLLPENLKEEETVRLPFFGVKSGNEAIIAIVKDGQEAATITANAGNRETGYSNAYVSFYARGYDITETMVSLTERDIYQMSDTIDRKKATVSFYPLVEENADYVDMAEQYREYLQEEGMSDTAADEQTYALYITGGAQVKELVLGLPVTKTKALTTFKEAKKMLEEVVDETKNPPAVQLKGFGKSGLDAGKVAGGFEFGNVFGSNKDRLALEQFSNDNKIPLYTDFDVIHFRSGGAGYSPLWDTAKSALSRKVTLYQKDKAVWNYNKKAESSYLLGRENLSDVIDKLEKTIAKKGISNVSLSSLGQTAYSDYSHDRYAMRGDSISDTQAYIRQLSEADVKVATESANAYAAAVSNSVFGVPTGNGDYTSLDVSIPLYQMVFKGYVSLYSTPLNTEADYEKALMLAVQSGTAPGFSLVGAYNTEFAVTPYSGLNGSDYKGNKEAILETLSRCTDYYSAIQGQSITDYEYISPKLTKTIFSNGVTVYANHSDQAVVSPLGELEGYGFLYEKGVAE